MGEGIAEERHPADHHPRPDHGESDRGEEAGEQCPLKLGLSEWVGEPCHGGDDTAVSRDATP